MIPQSEFSRPDFSGKIVVLSSGIESLMIAVGFQSLKHDTAENQRIIGKELILISLFYIYLLIGLTT